jgi:hypothetical protein
LRLLEQQDRGEQELLQQRHLTELGVFAKAVQEDNLAQLRATLVALRNSRVMTEQRHSHYARLHTENISTTEYQVMEAINAAKIISGTSTALEVAGAVIDTFPNVFGLANGGHQLGSIPRAASYGLRLSADIILRDAEKDATSESYRRRREDWGLARDQAAAEITMIDEHIKAQEHAVAAAETGLTQTIRANAQARELYDFLLTRATRVELYRWYLGQCKTFHYQAYDKVLSLCLSAQTALQAETAEFGASHIRTDAWLDSYYGLTAGDALRLDLLRMESDYLQRYERRLEMVKTVSLRQLFDDETDPQVGQPSWTLALKELRISGTLSFKLSQMLFDRDYHNHYCRQISAVEVTLATLLSSYENVCATLTQIGSATALAASPQSLEYLHGPGDTIAPADVLLNVSSGESMAISMGLDDVGQTVMKPDEGLRNVFENTGAVSRWTLYFPWPECLRQGQQLADLTDIILKVRYTAKVGGPSFSRMVQTYVNNADKRSLEGLKK